MTQYALHCGAWSEYNAKAKTIKFNVFKNPELRKQVRPELEKYAFNVVTREICSH
jgi:hypothetical protein